MKGNIMMRLIALMILVPAILAHFSGQIDLTQPTWLWLTLLAGLNALQSTFTGWCPATVIFGKDKNSGQCCASDSTGSCCEPVVESRVDTDAKTSEEKSSGECCSNNDAKSTCGSKENQESKAADSSCCENGSDCLDIKVLGTGCKNCTTTMTLIEAVATEMNVKYCIAKVEDITEIAAFGVMATPGVAINGKVVHSGSIPTKAQVTDWLSSPTEGCCS